MKKKNPYLIAFILVTSLFFLWGFAHNLDPILIPHLKKSFTLSTTQATLVDSAVYLAYFLMALPAGYIMKRMGYKGGIIVGLLLFAVGCFLFVPSANYQSYNFFLIALFIIACGLTTLETAANPYSSLLGNPDTATFRLNLSQSFNGLAAALAPFIGSKIIFTKEIAQQDLNAMSETARKFALASEASTVKTPYIVLGSVLIVIAIIFAFTKLPKIQQENMGASSKSIFHALKHRHLRWSVIAQFFYVGAQTCVFSLFILYVGKSAGLSQEKAAIYQSFAGIAFLVGRFFGTFLMRFIKPQNLLAIYAIANILLSLVAMLATGMTTVYALIGIYFFLSIMFPTIFALGIKDLKGDTEYGSSLIIMSIVGGAVLPLLFGLISDQTNNIQLGYIVPAICFVIIFFFGWKGYKVVRDKN